MNLVDDDWLPIIDHNGIFRKVSLLELFTNGRHINDFVLPVSERIAIMRFLLCLTYASAGIPEDRIEWREIAHDYENKVIDYLEKNKSLFNLFDPANPFLQFPEIHPAGKDGMGKTDKLNLNLASGTTEALFDNEAENRDSIPSDQLARSLITIQFFALNGLTSQVTWGTVSSTKSAKRSLLFGVAHAFLIGKSVLESIHLNLLTFLDIQQFDTGTPSWEKKPKNFDEVIQQRQTFLGFLMPYRRLVLLSSKGDRMANGATGEEFFFPDPYLAIELRKEKDEKDASYHFARLKISQDFWRQFGGILFQKQEQNVPKHLAKLSQIQLLMKDKKEKSFEIWVGAIHADPGVNSKIISVVESRYHFSTYWTLGTESVSRQYQLYEEWLRQNEKIAESLKNSIKHFLMELVSNHKTYSKSYLSEKQKMAERLFWSRVTEFVPSFFLLNSEEEVEQWNKEWWTQGNKICTEIKESLIQPDSPRSYRAWAISRRKF